MARIRLVFALLLLSLLSGALAQTPVKGGTLHFGTATEPDTLDAAGAFDTAAMRINSSVTENLVRLGADGNPEPGLAESWDVSEDGLLWTFNIRPNVTFHDGTPLDAAAVVFNFERQMDTAHPYNQYGSWGWWDWMFAPAIDRVYAVGDMTVVMELAFPFSPLLAHLGISGAGTILSPTAIAEHGAQIGNHPVGTGPFMLTEWVRGDHITLTAFDDYWGEEPHLDAIIIRFIPDNTVRSAALTRGEIDIMTDFSGQQLEMLRQGGAQVQIAPALNVSYLAMNSKSAPFDDIRVRLAVQHAIDTETLLQALYGDLGEPALGPIPSAMWAFDPDASRYEYDPGLAKQYLADAGYENGLDVELSIYSAPRGYNPVGTELAQVVQMYLTAVGINATIKVTDYTAHAADVGNGNHQLAFFGWNGDDLDPDGFIQTLVHSANAITPGANNIAFIENPELDALIDQARTVTDVDERRALYLEAQQLVHESAGWIWLNGVRQAYALSPRVQGFEANPIPWRIDFSTTWLE